MDNEIKEINIIFPGQILDYVDTKEHLLELFNYITNLQEENKRLKEILKWKQNREVELFTIESVWETNKQLYDERNMYKLRIDKAIEYIKEYDTIRAYYSYVENGYEEYNYDEDFKKDLLNILKGSDE